MIGMLAKDGIVCKKQYNSLCGLEAHVGRTLDAGV